MRRRILVAERYAAALAELAREKDILDRVESDLGRLVAMTETAPRLGQVLVDHRVSSQTKRDLAAELLGTEVTRITWNFVNLLIDKRRERYIVPIYHAYLERADRIRNVLRVEVEAARDLAPSDAERLRRRLGEATGRDVRLEQRTDPALIGGIKLKVGDLVVDGSAEARLRRLNRVLKTAQIRWAGGV
ncbi:MAG: ATP synthase F1 subunit delta [Firmicutes bacterium]|nr:ATP synthase F1 subunit delta [Bacillota bacterium]